MPDKDNAVLVKTVIKQNKAMLEMMKTQSDKSEFPGPSILAGRQLEYSNKVKK